VIGINVAMAAGAQGIGFAIPINDAKEVLDDLIKKGKVIRPWLGIYMRDVDEKITGFLDLPFAEGVVITDVAPEGPAAKAGIRKYDVIKKIGDQKVIKSDEVSESLRGKKPGDMVSLLIYRDGHNITVTAKLGEAP
jgi:S1-C subfamily serine protease